MNIKMIAIQASILISVGAGIYTLRSSNEKPKEEKQHIHLGETNEKIYICPMHPQINSNNPEDTCPICGMDLVLAESNEIASEGSNLPDGHAVINISDSKKQLLGLKLAKVKRIPLFKTVTAPGRAAFDPELYTAQAEYRQALQQMNRVKTSPLASVKKNVKRMLESSRIRLKVLGLSDSEIEAIKPSTEISDNLLIYKKGGTVWIYADVFEMDLPGIEKGQTAKISANYLNGEVIAGTVTSTDQVVDPETRTAKVRVKIVNSPLNIRAESYVNVSIFVPLGEHISVPLDAIVDTGMDTYVFVQKEDNSLEPRKVTIKLKTDEMVAVSEGLEEGEHIVISGNFLIDSESRLKGVIEKMNASKN